MRHLSKYLLEYVLAFIIVSVVALVAFAILQPLPKCPDGYVLAGGGYGGRYHCIPGAEPVR